MKVFFSSFYVLTVIFWPKEIVKKAARKTMVKLTSRLFFTWFVFIWLWIATALTLASITILPQLSFRLWRELDEEDFLDVGDVGDWTSSDELCWTIFLIIEGHPVRVATFRLYFVGPFSSFRLIFYLCRPPFHHSSLCLVCQMVNLALELLTLYGQNKLSTSKT